MGGLCITRDGEDLLSMRELLQNAVGEGVKILDSSTGDLMKKIPCGFYPICTSTLGKESMVICGKLTRPKDHTRFGKLVYVCSDHQPDGKDMGVTEMIESRQTLEKGDKESPCGVDGLDNGGDDMDASSLTELEHSILDE